MSIPKLSRGGALFAALATSACVGGSPAGSLMGIAASFDPTGLSGMVAGQVMAAEAQAAAEQRQAEAEAMMAAYLQGMPVTGDPAMAGIPPTPPAGRSPAPSAAEQAAITGLAAAPVGTSIAWTDPVTGQRGRVTVRSVEQALGGRSCRHLTRTIEGPDGPATMDTTVCTGAETG